MIMKRLYTRKEISEELSFKLKKYVYDIVGCCQDVHQEQGPALTEYVYQESLAIALEQANIPFVKEYWFCPFFRGIKLKTKMRVDFLCKNKVLLLSG